MITENFVSFETAKLLKEKSCPDFGYSCIYDSEGNKAQTQSIIMKWLREVHKLAIIISPQWAEGDMRNPCRWYWEIRGLENIDTDVYSNPTCDTYEQACEAAIKYSIKNII